MNSSKNNLIEQIRTLVKSRDFHLSSFDFFINHTSLRVGITKQYDYEELSAKCLWDLDCTKQSFFEIIITMLEIKKDSNSNDYILYLQGSDAETVRKLFPFFRSEIKRILAANRIKLIEREIEITKSQIFSRLRSFSQTNEELLAKRFDLNQQLKKIEVSKINYIKIYNQNSFKKNELELETKNIERGLKDKGPLENINNNFQLLRMDLKRLIKAYKKEADERVNLAVNSFERYEETKEKLKETNGKLIVLNEKLLRLNSEMNDLDLGTKGILQNIKEVDSRINEMNSQKGYLLDLKGKLELLNTSKKITDSVIFFDSKSDVFKQLKTYFNKDLFSLFSIISFFTLFFIILIQYFFDNKIYSLNDYNSLNHTYAPLQDLGSKN